jgi:outer membrane protein assembly factor BamB
MEHEAASTSTNKEPEDTRLQRPAAMTRRALLGAGAGLLAANVATRYANAAPVVRRAEPSAGSWPLPAHDLRATRQGGPLPSLRERWRQSLAGGIPGAPALDHGRVYAASLGGIVAAFQLAQGAELWRRDLGTAIYGSGDSARELGFFGGVALAGKSIVVASDRVFCLDAATGATRWQTAPLRGPDSDDYFWGPPVIADGLLLVGSGSGGELPDTRGRLTAYSLADGALAWSTATVPEGGNGGGVIAPCSVDLGVGLAYIATGSPYQAVAGPNPGTCSLIAVRLSDGSIAWSDQVYAGDTHGFDFNSAPVIIGRILVAANKDGFYGWDRIARERLWHRRLTDSIPAGGTAAGPTSGPEGGPVATDDARVYVLSNDDASGGSVAAALDPLSGNVAWQTELANFTFAAPALTHDLVCVAQSDGTLTAHSKDNGTLVASADLGHPSTGVPATAAGRLVVGTGAEPFLPGDSLVSLD